MYELILPSGATETFPTLGEVLHRMSLKPPLAAESMFGKAENIEIWNGSGKCYSVEQRYNHLGVRMSLDDGNAHSIIDMMFDEVMPYARDALGKVKAPWQMTSAQWGPTACSAR